MSGKWDDPPFPSSGWAHVRVEAAEGPLSTCEMCETQKIRYVHYMRHPQHNDLLRVGCVCAGKMSGDEAGAVQQEKQFKSKEGARRRWPDRKWKRSKKGNPFLKASGLVVTIFQKDGGWKYSVSEANNNKPPEWGDTAHKTELDAKLAAFETWWQMKES